MISCSSSCHFGRLPASYQASCSRHHYPFSSPRLSFLTAGWLTWLSAWTLSACRCRMTGWHISVGPAVWYFCRVVLSCRKISFFPPLCRGDCSHHSWASAEFSSSDHTWCLCPLWDRGSVQQKNQEHSRDPPNIFRSTSPGSGCGWDVKYKWCHWAQKGIVTEVRIISLYGLSDWNNPKR